MGVGGWVCPPHSLPYTLTTTRRANKLILKSRIGTLPPCAGTLFLGFWPGGFDAWKGRWKNRKRWDRAHETQPRPWSTSPEAGTRPRRRRGVGPRPAPTASHHLPRGGMAARAIHSPRVHKREPRSQQHRWTPRGPAPSRRSITGHGAQKAGAHTLCAHPLARRPRVLVGASARHQRAYNAPPWEEVAGSHAWGRMERQRALVVLGFATPSRGVLAELRGAK